MAAKIIKFSNRKKVIGCNRVNSYLADDYYIMISELAELTDKSEKTILRDIDKGILRADKINGDLLIPMDMADAYIEKSLDRQLLYLRIFAVCACVVILITAIWGVLIFNA